MYRGFTSKEWDQWVDVIEGQECKSNVYVYVFIAIVAVAIIGSGILEHFYLTI